MDFKIGIIGMGGFARLHHDAILRLERAGLARLVCACDPNADDFAEQRRAWGMASRGVEVFKDYRAMLASCAHKLDVVIVPTPIPLHLEMHRACIEAGVSCYLEKPPTLIYSELEAMIDADLPSEKKTFVGFNYISEPTRLALKARLLAGEFGPIERGSLTALWRRPISYFQRNSWVGRLRHEGALVLDSCFGNAMAHFVHNMLFWVGPGDLHSWGAVDEVRAELYRANNIESADTFFVEATAGGVPLRFALSHACDVKDHHVETIVCERATIHYSVGKDVQVVWKNGRTEVIPFSPYHVPDQNHVEYFRYLRGEISRPTTTLKDCRPFVYLNDLAHISSGMIEQISPDKLTLRPHDHEEDLCVVVMGIEDDFKRFIEHGIWPGARGWGREIPAEVVTPRDLPRLYATVDAMLESAAPVLTAGSVPA